MLIVIGQGRIQPDRRQEMGAAVGAMVGDARNDDGCVSYSFFRDLVDDDVLVNVEVWRDQEALDAHMGHAHTQEFFSRIGPLLDGEPTSTIHSASV